jgi:hypothetical protein
MDTTILAVDLGKFNSVLRWYKTATRSARFKTFRTTEQAYVLASRTPSGVG